MSTPETSQSGRPSPSDSDDAKAALLMARDPDVRLMLEVRQDVEGAFAYLVSRYQSRLLGIMTHLVGGSEEAEDLCQEVFLRVYRARKGYRPRAKFSTWLFTIANHVASNHLRSRRRHPTVQAGVGSGLSSGLQIARPGLDQVAAEGATPSAQLRHLELSEVVREAVSTLADDQRLAVLLNKFEGMSYHEIAEVMNRSEAAIKSLLARARNNLRESLHGYLAEGQRFVGGDGDGRR